MSSPTRTHGTLAIRVLLLMVVAGLCGCRTSTTYNADGVRQFQRGEYQAAMDKFQQAIAVNPNDADAYYNLAATLHDWGRRSRDTKLLEQSESLYHRCLDISGNHVDCYRALAVLLVDTDRRDSAFKLLELWAQRSPNLSQPRVELARLHEEHGNDESARQYLAQALDANSADSRAWAAMGRLREREGRLAQALTDYQHAYDLNRYHPGVPARIAALQQRMARVPTGPSVTGSGTGTRMTQNSTKWVPATR